MQPNILNTISALQPVMILIFRSLKKYSSRDTVALNITYFLNLYLPTEDKALRVECF
jgi:hypothetical protein